METLTSASEANVATSKLRPKKPAAVETAAPDLRGVSDFDDPLSIASEEHRLRYGEGAYFLQTPVVDPHDAPWDDNDDFDGGVFESEMPAGIDGKPLEGDGGSEPEDFIEEEIITRIPSLIRCGFDSSRLPREGAPREDAKSLLAFAAAWRKVNADPQKPARLTYVHNPPIDPDDRFAQDIPDTLILADGTGIHEITADAFYKALDPHLGEPDLPYFVEPDSRANAKLILQIINSLSIDGYKGNFAELVVVDENWQEIDRVEAESPVVQTAVPIHKDESVNTVPVETPAPKVQKPIEPPVAEIQAPQVTKPEPDFFTQLKVLMANIEDKAARLRQIGDLLYAYKFPHRDDGQTNVIVYYQTGEQKGYLTGQLGLLEQALGKSVKVKQIGQTPPAPLRR